MKSPEELSRKPRQESLMIKFPEIIEEFQKTINKPVKALYWETLAESKKVVEKHYNYRDGLGVIWYNAIKATMMHMNFELAQFLTQYPEKDIPSLAFIQKNLENPREGTLLSILEPSTCNYCKAPYFKDSGITFPRDIYLGKYCSLLCYIVGSNAPIYELPKQTLILKSETIPLGYKSEGPINENVRLIKR